MAFEYNRRMILLLQNDKSAELELWTQLLANEEFLTYPHTLLQVGIYAPAHAYSNTSRGRRKSEDNFDFESTDS